jgi:molybdopterin biosynthesis enzyme
VERIETRLRQALVVAARPLSPEEVALLRSRIENQIASARRLRAVVLANGDEPAHAFDPLPTALPARESVS